jgi:hypothetical protein
MFRRFRYFLADSLIYVNKNPLKRSKKLSAMLGMAGAYQYSVVVQQGFASK